MFDVAHIHPMLVHFPIALTLLGCLLEFIAIMRKKPSKCGETILYFAAFSAILAASAGALFTPNFTEEKLAAAKNIHSTVAGIAVTLLCAASAFYIGMYLWKQHAIIFRKIGFAFYVGSALAVAVTGFLGGVLVYNDLLKM